MVDKKAAIEVLFNSGWEQKDIARILKLSEVTISKHVTEKKLRKKRINFSLNRKTSEENTLVALAHQTKIIRLISEKLAEKLTDNLDEKELAKLLIPKGEIDAVQKLFTTIKNKELDFSATMQIVRELMAFVKDEDLELAQDLVPFIDNYINLKRKT